MRLVLEQQRWPELAPEVAASAPLPHIVLVPVTPWNEDLVARRQEWIQWNVPAGATATIVYEELVKSLVEWPMRLVELHIAVGGEVVEVRLCAFYVLLEFWGGAIWRGTPAAFQADRAEIRAAVAGGRPDWRRRELIALHQLFDST